MKFIKGPPVQKRELQRSMYELRDASMAQRLALAGIAGVWVVIAWWLLLGRGLAVAGGWFGWTWGSETRRRVCLAREFSSTTSGFSSRSLFS